MEISLKQVGQNLILTIDGETITKRVEDKELRDKLKEKVVFAANSKSKKAKEKLVKVLLKEFNAKTTEAESKKKMLADSVKKVAKRKSKEEKKGKAATITKAEQKELRSVEELVKENAELQKRIKELEEEQIVLIKKAVLGPGFRGEH